MLMTYYDIIDNDSTNILINDYIYILLKSLRIIYFILF